MKQQNHGPEYERALRFLEERTDYERMVSIPYSEMGRNLARLKRFAAFLDLLRGAPTVHVAGTKGKGSTALLLEKCLRGRGYRTGLFTSPHLFRWEERFALGGKPCAPGDLAETLLEIERRLNAFEKEDPGEIPFSSFELSVAAALLLFKKKNVDFIILETGLGGRIDATNICSPDLCILTSLGYEHQAQLGSTLAEIAAEKGGIIKPHVPVVSGIGLGLENLPSETGRAPLPAFLKATTVTAGALREGIAVIRKIAAEKDAPLIEIDSIEPDAARAAAGLIGEAQKRNVQITLAALDELARAGLFSGNRQEALRSVSGITLPARGQIVRRNPTWLLDGAHTRDSAAALARALGRFGASRKTLVFSALAGKDVSGMLWELLPQFDRVLLTEIPNSPRRLGAEFLFARAAEILPLLPEPARPEVEKAPDLQDLLRKMSRLAPSELVCFTGSFYLAAAAAAFLSREEEPHSTAGGEEFASRRKKD